MIDVLKTFPVIIEQAVQWGDMDAFGHVNNVVNFRYFEDARIEYFEQLRAMKLMDQTKIGPIMANANCDFKAPLHFPDTISIACRISDIHSKKFTMHFAVYSHTLEKITAQGKGLIVYFDYAKNQSCEIPENIVNQIHELERSVIKS